jgi:hypothetical protein
MEYSAASYSLPAPTFHFLLDIQATAAGLPSHKASFAHSRHAFF